VKTVLVAACALIDADGRVLLAQRPEGKPMARLWEFPGGKVRNGEKLEEALARELREELGVTLTKSREVASVRHQYGHTPEELEIHFFAAAIAETEIVPRTFEQVAWVLPKELSHYDFLAANRELLAHLATGKIKPGETLELP